MQRRQRRRSIFLPSSPLPHAEAGASPGLEILGVPSLLCTRVSFELCAYSRSWDNVFSGKLRIRGIPENIRREFAEGPLSAVTADARRFPSLFRSAPRAVIWHFPG